jgi:NAD(P)-dependent dehydrogenase (short-subunit alcohol dehydrogenase family)
LPPARREQGAAESVIAVALFDDVTFNRKEFRRKPEVTGRLANKNAIITGGAHGIGLAIARLFGREGARIALVDRDRESAESAANGLRREGIEITVLHADVSDSTAVAAGIAQAAALYEGVIHVLVNNAGIAEFGSVEETTLDTWERILAVNVTGTFLCSQAVLPHMKAQGGSIVNLASIGGLIGIPGMAAYCASKAAIIGLTRQMAADYTGLGIRVNCLCPGRVAGTAIDQYIMQHDTDDVTRAKIAKYPIGRFGRPEEIANAALFLASDDASYASGAAFCVDGGMTAV